MPRKPTDKQKKAVSYLAANPEATVSEAMREAGYTETTIDRPGQNFVGLPSVQSLAEQFQIKLDAHISNERIINKLDKLMDAQKVVSAQVIVNKSRPTSQADGELPLADSRSNDFIEVDDAPTQLKATQLVMQAKQLFGSLAQTTIGTQNNLTITDEQLQRLIGKTD